MAVGADRWPGVCQYCVNSIFRSEALKKTLPMHPAEATPIGDTCFSFASVAGRVVYLSSLEPFDFRDKGDRGAIVAVAAHSSASGP